MKGVHKNFDVKKVKEYIVNWIKEWFDQNGKDCAAVVGISGGLDSTVVAALCVKALGRDRVLGVLMPCGEQKDIKNSYDLCTYLKIYYKEINIQDTISALSVSNLNTKDIGGVNPGGNLTSLIAYGSSGTP